MRKLIDIYDDTLDKLKQLGRDRMATLQELADEAFVALLKAHGVPIDLKDALRKSAAASKATRGASAKPTAAPRKVAAAKHNLSPGRSSSRKRADVRRSV